MSGAPLIHVIHRQSDHDRLDFIDKKYHAAGLRFEIIPAIDGHDFKALKPHLDLIAPSFWDKPEIKPGALGCFLSHRKAWQKLVASSDETMVIAEDDTRPIPPFKDIWHGYAREIANADCLFLNDRTAEWVSTPFMDVNAVIASDQTMGQISGSQRAPGADGYMITRKFAGELLRLSEQMGVICGVDYFILGALWNADQSHIPAREEFAFLARAFAQAPKTSRGIISKRALFKNNRAIKSAIKHSETVNIAELRRQIESA